MEQLIYGVSAKCKHDVINEFRGQCAICEWEAILLKKRLPFKVRYIGTLTLTKNGIYNVIGIMSEGNIVDGPVPGFLLKTEDGDILERTFDMSLFSTKLEP